MVNGASFDVAISENSWITITGSVNGKAAYIEHISPTQINAVGPADNSVSPVEVRVTSSGVTSDAAIATLQAYAPALLAFDGEYLAPTQRCSASPDCSTTPVKPGETVAM